VSAEVFIEVYWGLWSSQMWHCFFV